MAKHSRGRYAKKIDNLFWDGGSSTSFALAAGGSSAFELISAGNIPATWLRMRGIWSAWLDSALAPPKSCKVTMGIILVPEGSGTTVQFNPVADDTAPWLWWDVMHLAYEEYVTDVIASTEMASHSHVIDNKAMRRIRPAREVQLVFESTNLEGSPACNVAFDARILRGN